MSAYGSSVRATLLATVCIIVPAAVGAQEYGESIELDPIVVSAAGVGVSSFEAPASVSVITGEELERQGVNDLTDVVAFTPGVSVAGSGDAANIYIRGVPAEYTLILIDGQRLNSRVSRQNNAGGVDQYYIPPASAIDRIEIVRGPMSSLYGADAVGGVINIITKPVASEWTGSVTLENTFAEDSEDSTEQQASFYLSGPLVGEKLGLQLWGRHLDRDGSTRMENGRYVGEDSRELTELAGRLTWAPSLDHRFTLEAGKNDNRSESEIGTFSDWPRRHGALGYEGFIAGWDVISLLSYEHAKTRNSASRTDRRPEIETTVFDLKGSRGFDLYGFHEFTLGMQVMDTVLTDQNLGTGTLDYGDFDNLQTALFLEDIWAPVDRLSVTFGARYTDDEQYGNDLSPRVYALYDLNVNWKLSGGIATGFRAPDIRETAPDYLSCTSAGCASVAPGSTDLDPEESTNYEIGLRFLNANSSFNITAFHTDYRNRISTRETGETIEINGDIADLDEWYNIDKAEVQGVEVGGRHFITPTLEVSGSYTFAKSEQLSGVNEGEPLSRAPEHQASLRFDWVTPIVDLDAWAAATYFGKSTNISSRTRTDLASYTTFDVGAVYRITDNVILKGAIDNLGDREITNYEHGTSKNGRTYWVALTGEF